MFEISLESLIVGFGYVAIFGCMFTNGVSGLPSSPFVYLTAGFLISTEQLNWTPVLVWGTLGNTLGNIFLYETTRWKGLQWVINRNNYLHKHESFIKNLEEEFRENSIKIVSLGKFIPIVKVLIPIIAGAASMQRVLFVICIFMTSFAWAIAWVSYGFYFGDVVEMKESRMTTAMMFVGTALVFWLIYLHIKKIFLKK